MKQKQKMATVQLAVVCEAKAGRDARIGWSLHCGMHCRRLRLRLHSRFTAVLQEIITAELCEPKREREPELDSPSLAEPGTAAPGGAATGRLFGGDLGRGARITVCSSRWNADALICESLWHAASAVLSCYYLGASRDDGCGAQQTYSTGRALWTQRTTCVRGVATH